MKNYIIAGLFIIVIVLTTLLLRRTPVPLPTVDYKALKKKIELYAKRAEYWETQAKNLEVKADSLLIKVDSLENVDPIIKHHYHEIYKFIDTASNNQLDSIIRANW